MRELYRILPILSPTEVVLGTAVKVAKTDVPSTTTDLEIQTVTGD